MKSLKEELSLCDVQIKAQMGSAAAGFIGDEHVITSKDVTRTSIDTKKLKAEYPEAAEACSKTSTSRRYSY
jgi:predicted phage-related endonuclease